MKQSRKGVFVATPRRNCEFITEATGVFDDLSSKGMVVEERTYEFGLFDVDAEEAEALRLPEGFKVVRFLRVYVADGTPLSHTWISLPAHRVLGIEKIDMTGRSIFGSIRERCGLTVSHADRWFTAASVDTLVAARLKVEAGRSLLHAGQSQTVSMACRSSTIGHFKMQM